jgi:hypothetical protein
MNEPASDGINTPQCIVAYADNDCGHLNGDDAQNRSTNSAIESIQFASNHQQCDPCDLFVAGHDELFVFPLLRWTKSLKHNRQTMSCLDCGFFSISVLST